MSERIVKTLPVMLTDAQVNEWARKAAALAGEEDDRATQLESAKERAKTIVKEAESALSSKRIERSQAARIARERCEWKEVDCEERISRDLRRAVVTRLDTLEVVSSRPVSDDEMRRGATWKPNYAAQRSELRHPDEPDVVLDVRALSDAEKQVPLPGTNGEVKATTLAEAAAIAQARENGDLPPAEGEPYEPKGPATSVTSEQLDKLTPVEAKPESRMALGPEALASMGIEAVHAPSNDNGGPAVPTATVFVLPLDEAARTESRALPGFDWMPDAAGTQLESELLDAAEAVRLREIVDRAGVVVLSRAVAGRRSETTFRASALRSAYDALSKDDKDAVSDARCDGVYLPGSWDDVSVGERIAYEGTLSADELEALKIAAAAVGLEVSSEPAVEYPCSEPGCKVWRQRDLLNGGGGTCAVHLLARSGLKSKLAKKAKGSKKSEQLDKLTPVEAKPESKLPSVASLGIEQRPAPSNDNSTPAVPTATVFVLSLEEAARPETDSLAVYDFLPDAAGTQLESHPVDAAEAKLLREAAQRTGVAVRERTVTGRPSPTRFEVSALRSAYEALSDENKDLLNEDVRAPDGGWLRGYWNDGAKDERIERIEYCDVVTRAESDTLLEYTKGLGLEAVAAPVDEYPCSEPGCEYWEQLGDLGGGGGTCHDHTVTRDKLKKKLAKPAGAAPKKGGKKGKVDEAKQLEALVVKHTDSLNAAKSAGALGDAWRAVAGLDLPDGHLARLEGVFDAKAKRLGLSPSTLAQMRAEDRAPAERPADAASA